MACLIFFLLVLIQYLMNTMKQINTKKKDERGGKKLQDIKWQKEIADEQEQVEKRGSFAQRCASYYSSESGWV